MHFYENRERDIPHFEQISVENFSFGGPIALSLHWWGEIWHGPLLRAKFHQHRCNVVSTLWGEKPQNRPMSNVNTGAMRSAMLPVISTCALVPLDDFCTSRCWAQRSSLRVRQGTSRRRRGRQRTTVIVDWWLGGAQVHKHRSFELDDVLQ